MLSFGCVCLYMLLSFVGDKRFGCFEYVWLLCLLGWGVYGCFLLTFRLTVTVICFCFVCLDLLLLVSFGWFRFVVDGGCIT